MRIRIDQDRCTGHGRCYTLSPSLFEDDDMGRGAVRGTGQVTARTAGDAERAKTACPESAVILERDDTPA
jgi:ferredoxin